MNATCDIDIAISSVRLSVSPWHSGIVSKRRKRRSIFDIYLPTRIVLALLSADDVGLTDAMKFGRVTQTETSNTGELKIARFSAN